jgi:hypothetical protein
MVAATRTLSPREDHRQYDQGDCTSTKGNESRRCSEETPQDDRCEKRPKWAEEKETP